MPEIYVSTYAEYSSGSLKGKWFDLEDYDSKDAFIEDCNLFHGPGDHEFMYQDWVGIPACFITESYINPDFWVYMDYEDQNDGEAKDAYCEQFGEWDEGKFEDRFCGKHDSIEDYATELVEELGYLDGVPDIVAQYFDYEAFARDLELGGDFVWVSGFVFRCY